MDGKQTRSSAASLDQPNPTQLKHITQRRPTLPSRAPTSSSVRKSMMPVLWPFESRNSPPKKGMKRFGTEIADMTVPYFVSLKCRSGSLQDKDDTNNRTREEKKRQ